MWILVLGAAAYYAYGHFVVRGGGLPWELPKPPRMSTPPAGELRREPGRGLNPFITDVDPPPAQRPRVPDVPGR
jgi:hypothetical protein